MENSPIVRPFNLLHPLPNDPFLEDGSAATREFPFLGPEIGHKGGFGHLKGQTGRSPDALPREHHMSVPLEDG